MLYAEMPDNNPTIVDETGRYTHNFGSNGKGWDYTRGIHLSDYAKDHFRVFKPYNTSRHLYIARHLQQQIEIFYTTMENFVLAYYHKPRGMPAGTFVYVYHLREP